jgi:hypothetical protein
MISGGGPAADDISLMAPVFAPRGGGGDT